MSDNPAGPGWWQASDGKWYPPQGDAVPSPPPSATPSGPQGPGWWRASDGSWYPPEQHPSYAGGVSGAPGATPYPAAASPPPSGPPPGSVVGPPPTGGGRSKAPLVIAIVAVLALLAAGVGWVLVSSGDDGDDTTDTASEEEDEGDPVLLQPIGADGPDPFTESVSISDVDVIGDDIPRFEGEENSALDVRQVSGTEPGLYGGTRDQQSCDAVQMADFLEENPELARAWAEVAGVDLESLRDYIIGLTPVLLLSDTWVTNHGYADGEATPFQAVLEAGTAVLIDDEGVPRARCACGNPLDLPEPDLANPAVTDGDAWDGYEASAVNTVEAGPALSTVTLVDVETGEEFERPLGGGQTGDVQVTLRWQGDSDLDLHVIGPDGVEIYYGATTSPTGGELDLDVIPSCGTSGDRTENIFWPDGSAPSGEYQVFVDNFSSCSGSAEPFELQVVANGQTQVSESGSLAPDTESQRFTFQG